MPFKFPGRYEKTAPQFVTAQVSSLKQYFDDLVKLFDAATADNAQQTEVQKKGWAVFYVDPDTKQLWEKVPTYAEATRSFDDFRKEVMAFYPGADLNAKRTYSVGDLNSLVLQYQARGGIATKEDLGNFYRQLFLLTSVLTAHDQVSKSDISRAFMTVFHPMIQETIKGWIERNVTDYVPGDAVELEKMYTAAEWALSGTGITSNPTMMAGLSTKNVPMSILPGGIPMATAPMAWQGVWPVQQPGNSYYGTGPNGPSNNFQQTPPWQQNGNDECLYCGTRGCRISRCPSVEMDIRDGLVYREPSNGRVYLANGGFIHAGIEGRFMKDKVRSWYKANPGHGTAPTQSNPTGAPPRTFLYEMMNNEDVTDEEENDDEPLAEKRLRYEIMLKERKQGFNRVVLRRSDRLAGRKPQVDNKEGQEQQEDKSKEQEKRPGKTIAEKVVEEKRKDHISAEDAAKINARARNQPRVRDFAHPPYAPPDGPTFGSKPRDPLFKNLPKIHDPNATQRIVNQMLDMPVTLKGREIFSISSDVSKAFKDSITPHKVAVQPPQTANLVSVNEFTEDHLPFAEDDPLDDHSVISDPILSWYHATGTLPEDLIVGVSSEAIRALRPTIAGRCTVDAVLDPGCSIVCMGDHVARDLALMFDPNITLKMQSANGTIDRSLGLATNVPFSFGNVTLYLQVHVVKDPPFDVLLGRPFDRVCESEVKTFPDGSQTVTITDPNNGKTYTVPSFDRKNPLHQKKPVLDEDFPKPKDN
ncbi:hypothetical protein DL96DRAFT_1480819 [Flagelloscypha sp. PMI_526]|nr:hypothetical protein DL96DRAFT_1480819 [Flagelloscypha sp. PMI_526]